MTRARLACIASTVSLLPFAVAGTATAQASGSQSVGQSAGSQQLAGSAATSAQVAPSNENISVRIGSPGSDGAVTQTNTSSAQSAAGNKNTTGQSATQAGADPAQQAIGQDASNAQAALSKAQSVQVDPSNQNISVRIGSPGDNGPVTQANTSSAQSAAGNENATQQTATQAGGDPANQSIGQGASNGQLAKSGAGSLQKDPSNANTPVRIGSPGGDGSVSQSNGSSASSAAGNENATTQKATQSAGDGAATVVPTCNPCSGRDMTPVCGTCGTPAGSTVQAIGQDASNHQGALSGALSKQDHPSNENTGGGSVTQSNTSDAHSAAGNKNATSQTASQSGGGGAGTLVQAIGQSVHNDQLAKSLGLSLQLSPANVNAGGQGGSVDQHNGSSASSAAGNTNSTSQSATQTAAHDAAAPAGTIGGCGLCDGLAPKPTVQAIGQDATSEQTAWSDAISAQICALNSNLSGETMPWMAPAPDGKDAAAPVPPAAGSVKQGNDSSGRSASGNTDGQGQGAAQTA